MTLTVQHATGFQRFAGNRQRALVTSLECVTTIKNTWLESIPLFTP